jgi:enoyl-CoA hydratase
MTPSDKAAETAAPEPELLYEQHDGIGLVTFNRPRARNALTFGMYRGLAEICDKAAFDESLKALIVTGAGERAFAAGTDIAQFREFRTADDALAYEKRIDAVLESVESCPVPTIAAITGACTGGGAAIAAACDIRIASRDLKFGFPIARTLGNCLSISNLSRLSALIGAGRTREIIFTARLIEAEEALAIALVSEVLEDPSAVVPRARELAETLTGHAPLTLRATKEALRRLHRHQSGGEDADLIALCYTSEDFREGLEAFLAKRKPVWKGR